MTCFPFLGVFEKMNREIAAYTIQSNWRVLRYCPNNKLCYRVEMSNIDAICIDYGIGSKEELQKQTPDFSDKILEYRRGEYQMELQKTRKFLLTYEKMKKRIILKGRRKKNSL